MKDRFNSYSPFLQVIILVLIGAVTFVLLSMIVSLILTGFYPDIPSDNIVLLSEKFPIQFMAMYFLPFQLGFLLTPGIIYFYISKRGSKEKISFNNNWIKGVLWSFALFISVFFLLPFISEINNWITKSFGVYDQLVENKLVSDEQLKRLIGEGASTEAYIFGLLSIGVITGIAEEFFFRGILFGHIKKYTNRLDLSVFGSALIFALLHFNYLQFLPLIAFGITLALMYHITKSIIPGIIMHTLNNILNVYWLRNDIFPSWMDEVWIEITIPSTLLLMGLIYIKRFELFKK